MSRGWRGRSFVSDGRKGSLAGSTHHLVPHGKGRIDTGVPKVVVFHDNPSCKRGTPFKLVARSHHQHRNLWIERVGKRCLVSKHGADVSVTVIGKEDRKEPSVSHKMLSDELQKASEEAVAMDHERSVDALFSVTYGKCYKPLMSLKEDGVVVQR